MDIQKMKSVTLNNFDLKILDEELTASHPTPMQTPETVDRASLRPDVIETKTVDFLLNQNDDLVARIKVLIKLVTQFENESLKYKKDFNVIQTKNHVFLEKEMIYKNHIKSLELKNNQLLKTNDFLKDLEKESGRLIRFVDRYEKYIRPAYKLLTSQFKKASLSAQVKSQENDVLQAQIRKIESEFEEISRSLRQHKGQSQQSQNELIHIFETQRTQFLTRIADLEKAQEQLTEKSLNYELVKEKNINLENTQIELTRAIQLLKSENTKYSLENADLKSTLKRLEEHSQRKEIECIELKEQIETLRYQWSKKSEDLEKASMSLNALEKINIDLSKKINELRSAEKN